MLFLDLFLIPFLFRMCLGKSSEKKNYLTGVFGFEIILREDKFDFFRNCNFVLRWSSSGKLTTDKKRNKPLSQICTKTHYLGICKQ